MTPLIILSLVLQVSAQTINVPIQNPSFELSTNLPDANHCGNSTWQNIPGWTFTQPPNTSYGVIAWTCETPPDGKIVAFLTAGVTMSQDLGVAPKAGMYVLHFFVGEWFYPYIAGYSAKITEGAKTVCSTSGWTPGDFTEITLLCPVSPYISNNDKFWSSPGNLVLTFSDPEGWPLLIDNVSLTFTPTN